MRKIIIKTAAIAVAGVIALFAVIVGIFSLSYPQGMARACESFGWYSLAANYSSLSYNYSGEIGDICNAVDDSAKAENDGKIIKYSEKLFADKGFEDFYDADNFKAQNYYIVYATALYRENRADDAVKVAADAIGRDANVPSALGALTVLVSEKGDKQTAEKLLLLVPEGNLTENQQKYYNSVKNVLTKTGG